MQQFHAENDRHRAFLVNQSQHQSRPEVIASEMQQWELEWKRMADDERANTA